MYTYLIDCFGYESTQLRHLVHAVKFEKEEFRNMVLDAMEEIIRRWLLVPADSVDDSHDLPSGWSLTLEDLAPMAADLLISEKGFAEMSVDESVRFSICNPPIGRVDPRSDTSNNALLDRISASGMLAELERKNKELQEYMYKEAGM